MSLNKFNPANTIRMWHFLDAPEEIQALVPESDRDDIEDVVYVPDEFEETNAYFFGLIAYLRKMCECREYEVAGGRVYITWHA